MYVRVSDILFMRQESLLVDVMGRPLNPTPTYVYHPRGTGRIYWRGEFRNLPGDFNSPESLAAYHRLCQIVAATGRLPDQEPDVLTVAQLVKLFSDYAQRRHKGTRNARYLEYATDAMVNLFADVPAAKFGPSSLKAVRSSMITAGLCRNTANKRTKQIVAVFEWAVEEELIEPAVWQALKAVRSIPRGRDGAIDYEPIGPVDIEQYRHTLKHVTERYRPALEVQRMTGMRSGELLAMRPQDVDMQGTHWYYRLRKHKTDDLVGERIIGIPAAATVVLIANMPRTWGHRWFPWGVDTHYNAVKRACERAGVRPWHPHQLRHGVATLCEQLFGDTGAEAARLLLGHTDVRTTRRYVLGTMDAVAKILDRVNDKLEGPKDDCDSDDGCDAGTGGRTGDDPDCPLSGLSDVADRITDRRASYQVISLPSLQGNQISLRILSQDS